MSQLDSSDSESEQVTVRENDLMNDDDSIRAHMPSDGMASSVWAHDLKQTFMTYNSIISMTSSAQDLWQEGLREHHNLQIQVHRWTGITQQILQPSQTLSTELICSLSISASHPQPLIRHKLNRRHRFRQGLRYRRKTKVTFQQAEANIVNLSAANFNKHH